MKTKKKSCSIVLTLTALALFLILVSSVASAYSVQSVSPTITEAQITANRSASCPAINGDKIVYQDSRNGTSDIYMYDLFTSKETQITTKGSVWGHPSIYGDRIVWQDARNGNFDIYMYNIPTKKEIQITTNGSAHNPAIYSDRIVWENRRNESSDVYMYDLSTSKKTQITTSGSNELAYNPTIFDDRIVWQNYRNGKWDIYIYDLSTSKKTQITNSGSATYPAIYSDRVVWIDSLNETTDIYMYNLLTSKKTQITTSGSAYSPVIDGDRIIYQDSRNGNPDIYMYNLSTKKETQVTTSGSAYSPVIDGDRIVYQDYRNGNSDIYMNIISEEETKVSIANFSSNATEGYIPHTVQITNLSQNSTARNSDFDDGVNSTEQNQTQIYSSTGTPTYIQTVSNANGTDSKLATINVSEQPVPLHPVADFGSNFVSGYAPLDVQFTDLSQNATAWNWDFGDGSTSTEQNPNHTYLSAGTYLVNLIVSNVNETASKNAMITVLADSSSSGGSSSGGSSGVGSPEPATNVEVKEISQAFIKSGNSVKFDFPRNATSVVYVSFDSKKTAGKTTTIVEMLKEKSTLVSGLPSDEVYKSLNIWVGNGGYATSNNIENAVVCFKVEKSWIHDQKIDKSSITLNRYSDGKWNPLSTKPSGENDAYLYFTAKTQGFSPFAITGKAKEKEAVTELQTKPNIQGIEQNNIAANVKQASAQKGNTSTPGFEIIYGIIGLLGVFFYRER
jgi:PGF-pre-PGF domain-containing protein